MIKKSYLSGPVEETGHPTKSLPRSLTITARLEDTDGDSTSGRGRKDISGSNCKFICIYINLWLAPNTSVNSENRQLDPSQKLATKASSLARRYPSKTELPPGYTGDISQHVTNYLTALMEHTRGVLLKRYRQSIIKSFNSMRLAQIYKLKPFYANRILG